MTTVGNEIRSDVDDFRKTYLLNDYELIDITMLCEFKLGHSGCCNEINQPEDKIYHIQVHYRDECIANFTGDGCIVVDDEKYTIFVTNQDDVTGADFIIFKLCPVIKNV